MNPVIGVSYTKLTNLVKSLMETEFYLKFFSAGPKCVMGTEFHLKFFSAGPNYWLGQLNLGGIIARIIILLWMTIFLSKSLLQLNWVYT